MTEHEQAVLDCKYAQSFGPTMLNMHIAIWLSSNVFVDDDEKEYHEAIKEIESKLGTEECLLK